MDLKIRSENFQNIIRIRAIEFLARKGIVPATLMNRISDPAGRVRMYASALPSCMALPLPTLAADVNPDHVLASVRPTLTLVFADPICLRFL